MSIVKTLTCAKSKKKYKFDISVKIGEGAFGSAHKGWEVGTNVPVAIKIDDIK